MADTIRIVCDNLGGETEVAAGTPLSELAATRFWRPKGTTASRNSTTGYTPR